MNNRQTSKTGKPDTFGSSGNPSSDAQARPPRGGSSFLARFGEVIVRHGIAAVPSALYHFQGALELTAQEVWFISAVLAHKWTEDLPYPNLNRMEKQTGVPERRLRRYKQRLCDSGLLFVYPRYDTTGRQDSNYYDFAPLFEQIESLIAEGARPHNAIEVSSDDGPYTDASEPELTIAPNVELPDTSFVARFGSTIVSRGVATVPQALFTFQGRLSLTPQQVWFVCYIFSVPWVPPYPYPSLLKMAARTGYSKMQLHEIKNGLVSMGLLRLVHRKKADGGQDSNGYDFAGLFNAVRLQLEPERIPTTSTERYVHELEQQQPSRPVRPPRQGKAAAQKRAQSAKNEGVTEVTGIPATQLTGYPAKELTRIGVNRLTGVGATKVTGEAALEVTGEVKPAPTTRLSASLPRRGSQAGHYIEPSKIEQKESDDSNQVSQSFLSGKNDRRSESLPYSPYLAAIVTDFSDELGDQNHIVSNVTQVFRIFASSGMPEQDFAQLLFTARKLVRLYQGKQGLAGVSNKMAYFFIVLRDLVAKALAE